MPKALQAMLTLLVVAPFALAEPPAIKLPSEIKAEAGSFVVVRADTEGKIVRFVALTPGLNVFPPEMLRDTKATVVTASRNGKYQLLAYTARGDEPSEPATVSIVIGQPGPDPTPPGPIPPPDPVDPLAKRIREALASDPGTAADKVKHAVALSGFYAAMAKHVSGDNAATVGDLLSDYRAAIPAILPADAIPATRKLAGQEVAAVCGTDAEVKIDGTMKAKLVDLFTRLSAALAVEAKR